MRAIPERLRGVITTRHYTNPRLPYLTLPLAFAAWLLLDEMWSAGKGLIVYIIPRTMANYSQYF